MLYKNGIEKAKERWGAWWNGELIDRCLVNITARKPIPITSDEQKILQVPDTPDGLLQYWTDPEWIVKRTRIGLERTWYGGDAFPIATVNLGAAGHAGFFKGRLPVFQERAFGVRIAQVQSLAQKSAFG